MLQRFCVPSNQGVNSYLQEVEQNHAILEQQDLFLHLLSAFNDLRKDPFPIHNDIPIDGREAAGSQPLCQHVCEA